MTIVIFTISSRFECENATFFLSQIIESEDSRSKKIQRIKRTIHSKEKFNKRNVFQIQWIHYLIIETIIFKKKKSCYAFVSSTNTSHLIIASSFLNQASLFDNLNLFSINRIHRFNDYVQIFNERIMKWAKNLNTKVLLNNSWRVSSRDIHFTTWKRLKYESSSTSKLFIS
jgi:hypothetical protein